MQPDENPANQMAQSAPDDTNNGGLPDDATQTVPDDHPVTDTNIDSHEAYDDGLDGASEAKEVS